MPAEKKGLSWRDKLTVMCQLKINPDAGFPDNSEHNAHLAFILKQIVEPPNNRPGSPVKLIWRTLGDDLITAQIFRTKQLSVDGVQKLLKIASERFTSSKIPNENNFLHILMWEEEHWSYWAFQRTLTAWPRSVANRICFCAMDLICWSGCRKMASISLLQQRQTLRWHQIKISGLKCLPRNLDISSREVFFRLVHKPPHGESLRRCSVVMDIIWPHDSQLELFFHYTFNGFFGIEVTLVA